MKVELIFTKNQYDMLSWFVENFTYYKLEFPLIFYFTNEIKIYIMLKINYVTIHF